MASKFIVLIFCLYFSAFNSSEPATTDKPIAIQIEVDIEPPADTDGLNGDQLARLGLPAHHVHYRAGQPAGSELLAPEDIQVSYTLKEEEEENGPETDIMVDSAEVGRHSLQRPQRPNAVHISGKVVPAVVVSEGLSEEMVFDPPRALPALEDVAFNDVATAVEVVPADTERPELTEEGMTATRPTVLFNQKVDPSSVVAATVEADDEEELTDGIYGVPAFCSLDCGSAGSCHMSRGGGESAGGWAARCLCPVGWRGEGCSQPVLGAEVAELTGLGYLALPTLQNAYSDLHLSLDFRPTAWTGRNRKEELGRPVRLLDR